MAEAADEEVGPDVSDAIKEDKPNDVERAEKSIAVAGSKKKGKKKKKDGKSSETVAGKFVLKIKSRTNGLASFYVD